MSSSSSSLSARKYPLLNKYFSLKSVYIQTCKSKIIETTKPILMKLSWCSNIIFLWFHRMVSNRRHGFSKHQRRFKFVAGLLGVSKLRFVCESGIYLIRESHPIFYHTFHFFADPTRHDGGNRLRC